MTATPDFEPRILGFLCNWCSYAGADLAGVSRFQFPPNLRVIRVMCSSRVDPAFVLRAFSKGIDGVLVGGCHLGECHYIRGNYDALSMAYLYKKLLEHIGLNPKRLRIEWVSASEGIVFAEIVSNFTNELKQLGPLGIGEGKDVKRLKLSLEAARRLVPYIKLVQTEKLRLPLGSEMECDEFFSRDDVNRLFHGLIVDKLMMSEILLLLGESSLSIEEISGILALSSSEVSRVLDASAKKGLARFGESQMRFVATWGAGGDVGQRGIVKGKDYGE